MALRTARQRVVGLFARLSTPVEAGSDGDAECHAEPEPQGWAVEHQQPEEKTEAGAEGETDCKARVRCRGLLLVAKHAVQGTERHPEASTTGVDATLDTSRERRACSQQPEEAAARDLGFPRA